ncbi:hypothetical protein C4D60_Mb02t02790 [Musa balbisiana]|uniref:Enoyl reductase (ER) domain-containing protein n=1 Tax=Musa balbisiana TaxID=52838 RepID=A0A4S8I7T2_MUSBA|nr:hypothetical protein C4D60_Mb02t02790 [Musa balbisiana]
MAGVEEMVRNKQVVLKHFVVGEPKETDMEFRVGKASLRIPEGVEGAILVKNLYLSCDPYMRGRMREYYESYISPFQPGSVIEGFGVAKVVDSTNPKFSVGDYIVGLTGWEEHSVIVRTEQLRKIETLDVPLSYHVGLLGMPGFTAYVGFYEICAPKKGDYFFVSAASGAVGQLVGQLAKLHGCYVVGSAGSAKKVDLLKNKLGFDEAFNYKEEPDLTDALKSRPTCRSTCQATWMLCCWECWIGKKGMPGFTAYVGFYEICAPKKGDYFFVSAASGAVGQLVGQLAKLHGCYVVGSAGSAKKVDLLKNKLGFDEAFNYKEEPDLTDALKRYFPKGIDIYFDNVGGAMLDAALMNMRVHGRVAICGMVSQHSISDPKGISNLYTLVMKRVRMQGFIQSDYLHLHPEFLKTIVSFYKQGKIVYIEDMNEGLENGPAAFVGLFSGKNVGKQIVRVAQE